MIAISSLYCCQKNSPAKERWAESREPEPRHGLRRKQPRDPAAAAHQHGAPGSLRPRSQISPGRAPPDAEPGGRRRTAAPSQPDFAGPGASGSPAAPMPESRPAGRAIGWLGKQDARHEFAIMPDPARVTAELLRLPSVSQHARTAPIRLPPPVMGPRRNPTTGAIANRACSPPDASCRVPADPWPRCQANPSDHNIRVRRQRLRMAPLRRRFSAGTYAGGVRRTAERM